jgi:hypothetical protein
MTTQIIRADGNRLAATARSAADLVCLAAAPTFAVMALLSCLPAGNPHEMICSVMRHAAPLNGMAWMYLLMSAFHTTPWLKLISSR